MAGDPTPDAAEDDAAGGGARRDLSGLWRYGAEGLGVFIALAHIYMALFAEVSELGRNAFHFAGFALLAALWIPPLTSRAGHSRAVLWIDFLLGAMVAASAIYLVFAESMIYKRDVNLSTLDWIASFVVVIAALEYTRRAAGLVIPILAILALSYVAFWGQFVGGVFAFRGLSLETVTFRSIYNDDALFGTIAGISATYVFLFIIFGSFLVRSGAGDFVVNLARAVAGKTTGGPGLVAVIASGLTGTISGSAVANTASTGVITIPLMKRAGFPPAFAGAVEASASTGGQVMPPIMGAGAFLMASYAEIPYEQIVAVAALPALLYFASVAMFVRIEAKRQGLKPFVDDDGPTLGEAFRQGGASFVIPISVLIGLLVSGFTPTYAAVIGIAVIVVSSWLTQSPMGPRAVVEALALGARTMIMTAMLLCAIGLIVNVVTTAGVGNTFSLMISDWSGGNLLIAITLVALASLVLGMGLPVTAAYIVLATLSAPALSGMIQDSVVAEVLASGALPEAARVVLMLGSPEAAAAAAAGPMPLGDAQALVAGLPLEIRASVRDLVLSPEIAATALLSAHMIVFWLSQDSNVTPPVCLAAFTAAAIAGSRPMYTGFQSWKVAKGLYVMPLLFAYTPFLAGDWAKAFEIFLFALIGVYALAGALQGCMESRIGVAERVAAGVAGVACLGFLDLSPIGLEAPQLLIQLVGAGLTIALLAWSARRGAASATPENAA